MGEQVFEITMHDARPKVQSHNGTTWVSLTTEGAKLTLFLPNDPAYLRALANDFAAASRVVMAHMEAQQAYVDRLTQAV